MGSSAEFQASILAGLTSTMVTLICGHLNAMTAQVGPPRKKVCLVDFEMIQGCWSDTGFFRLLLLCQLSRVPTDVSSTDAADLVSEMVSVRGRRPAHFGLWGAEREKKEGAREQRGPRCNCGNPKATQSAEKAERPKETPQRKKYKC